MTRSITRRPARSLRAILIAAATLFAVTLAAALPAAADDERRIAEEKRRLEEQRQIERKMESVVIHDGGVVPCEKLATVDESAVRRTQRGFLGIELTSLTEDLLRHFGVGGDDGVLISKVTDDSPASRSDLRVGDIVTRIGDQSIDGTWDVGQIVRHRAGETVEVEVYRDGSLVILPVTLGSREMCSLDIGSLLGDLDVQLGNLDLESISKLSAEIGAQGALIGTKVAAEVARAMQEIDWNHQLESLSRLEEIEGERLEKLQERLELLEEELEREFEGFDEEFQVKLEKAMREKERALRAQERELREQVERRAAQSREMAEQSRQRVQESRERVQESRRLAHEKAARAEEEARRAEEEAAAEAAEAEEAAEEEGGGTHTIYI